MVRVNDGETQFLNKISSGQRKSLSLIRNFVKDIWNSDQIINEFGHHGIKHGENIANLAFKLSEANQGRLLSSDEIFLILSAAYLHDIGILCDIQKYPEIKEIAEKYYNLKFDPNFLDLINKPNNIKEKKFLRDNHHLFTAAWIKFAHQTGRSSLGEVLKSVPTELIGDLIDICRYHSKIPIGICDVYSADNDDLRKQLIVAILRLSDALDIDTKREHIDTIEKYENKPENVISKWIQNRTEVSFISNTIEIRIGLNASDKERYGSLIYDIGIAKFQTKNKPIISILVQNNIPIIYGPKTGVMENQKLENLPDPIVLKLEEYRLQKEKIKLAGEKGPIPAEILSEELTIWLRAIIV